MSRKRKAALQYATWGWRVFPLTWVLPGGGCSCRKADCNKPGKHPLWEIAATGFKVATTDKALIAEWWKRFPEANIGFATGAGWLVIDTDKKEGLDGEESLDRWQLANGPLPDTAASLTGGGGVHRFFSYDPDLHIPCGQNVLGTAIDVRADGGYVVLPPSDHVSGQEYAWDFDHDPTEHGITDAPRTLLAACKARPKGEAPEPAPLEAQWHFVRLSQEQVDEIRSALDWLPEEYVNEYQKWVLIGQALHSTMAQEQAFALWKTWSQKSAKYDGDRELRKKWRTFGADRGITIATLFGIAKEHGWVNAPQLPPDFVVQDTLPQEDKPSVPSELLTIPGVLGQFVAWANGLPAVRQPQFAVQAGLALGAVALGRNWRTDRNNWSPLYLMCIGPSGCGKDNVKHALQMCLTEAGFGHLLNGSGYTSDGAVYSALLAKPTHLAIIDEIGLMLEGAKSKGNHVGASAVRTLMEAFSCCHNQLLPKTYSTMTLRADVKKELTQRIIFNPALSIIGLTTGRQFFGALSTKELENGFLNRWLIVETDHEWGFDQVPSMEERSPQAVRDWIRLVREEKGDSVALNNAEFSANPWVLPIGREAMELFEKFKLELREVRTGMGEENYAELWSRANELAMKVALIVAVSDGERIGGQVRAQHAAWSIHYVRFYTERLIQMATTKVHDSADGGAVMKVALVLRTAGAKGMTKTDLHTHRLLKEMGAKARTEALNTLCEDGLVGAVKESGRTKPRTRYFWADNVQTRSPSMILHS